MSNAPRKSLQLVAAVARVRLDLDSENGPFASCLFSRCASLLPHVRGRKPTPKYVPAPDRYISAHVSQEDANERTRRTHFRAIAALEGQSGGESPSDDLALASPRPISTSHNLTAAAVHAWSNSASPMLLTPAKSTEDGRVSSSNTENRKVGSRSLPSRRRQGGGSGDVLSLSSPELSLGVNAGDTASAEVGSGAVTDADSAADVTERMSMKQLRELELSLGMDEAKVCLSVLCVPSCCGRVGSVERRWLLCSSFVIFICVVFVRQPSMRARILLVGLVSCQSPYHTDLSNDTVWKASMALQSSAVAPRHCRGRRCRLCPHIKLSNTVRFLHRKQQPTCYASKPSRASNDKLRPCAIGSASKLAFHPTLPVRRALVTNEAIEFQEKRSSAYGQITMCSLHSLQSSSPAT